jgi:hypothetical protein
LTIGDKTMSEWEYSDRRMLRDYGDAVAGSLLACMEGTDPDDNTAIHMMLEVEILRRMALRNAQINISITGTVKASVDLLPKARK